jgi:hypothetical protein
MSNPLGWWAISGEAIIDGLRRAHDGENPDVLYAELYANSRTDEGVGNE